jgi:hypothetical protein
MITVKNITGDKLKKGDVFLWRSGMTGRYEIHTFHSDAGYGIKTFTGFNKKDNSSEIVNYSGVCGKITNDDYENAITLLYKVHPYIMGTNDELSDEIREFLLSIPDRDISSYHHKCIKCKSIFKNNVPFYKSHKERICPNCISK